MKEEYASAVIAHLEKIYGETNPEDAFENRVFEIAERIAREMAPEIVSDQFSMSTPKYRKRKNKKYFYSLMKRI